MIVLDASALVDVVADRPAKPSVLPHLDGQRIIAPAHQLAEVGSAVMRLLRAGELDEPEAQRARSDAATLVQDTYPLDDEQVQRAFTMRASIRFLDGLYVALAERFECPLVTTDGRLARSNPPCEIIDAAQAVERGGPS